MATILITGANRGIGLALAQQFAARGEHVIGVGRHRSDALDATGAQVEAGIDVTDGAAIDALAHWPHVSHATRRSPLPRPGAMPARPLHGRAAVKSPLSPTSPCA